METESVRMHAKGTRTSCCGPTCHYLSHYIYVWSVNVNMRILKASVEWVKWSGMRSHFCVQPNYSAEVVLWLCYFVVGVVTICYKTCRSVYKKGENTTVLNENVLKGNLTPKSICQLSF